MKLKSFGCSFIYGNDLLDCPHGINDLNPPPSSLTWPALLANKYGLDYQCHARPGSGNLQILETLLSTIDKFEQDLYVIKWSWIDRFSYISEKCKSGTHPWNPKGWNSIMPSTQDSVSNFYYRHIHSQFKDKLETLIYIKIAIDTLIERKQKFIMTYTDELIWETKWHTSPAIENLQQYICSHVTKFEGQGFLQWARSKGLNISEKWHPLEQAHQSAAEFMIPKVYALLMEKTL